MPVLETGSFQLERAGRHYYFCSARCQETFAKTLEGGKETSFRLKWTGISLGLFALLFLISATLSSLQPLNKVLSHYLGVVWWAVGLGLLLGGLVDYYVPKEYISYFLAGESKRTILHAAFLGFLSSACSHGILALSMALYKKGASVAAVIAFLLASPWANLSVTFLLLGLFGLKGFVLIFSAVLVAFVTGFLFQILARRHWIETNPNTLTVPKNFSVLSDIQTRWGSRQGKRRNWGQEVQGVLQSSGMLSEMVLPWTLLGVTMAGGVGAFVPETIFTRFFGPSVLGLLLTLFAATVIEICSEGSAPLVFELYRSGGAFGNAFVFLMAGVATDYTEIGLLWANIGKKTAFWMILLTVPQVLFLGFLFNHLF